MNNPEERPIIDYANLPYLPHEGIRAGGCANKFYTRSLFLELCNVLARERDKAIWTLSETEVFENGRWYPSAWQAYIHSVDEYDALRKICGNLYQWEKIKLTFERLRPWMYPKWVEEQKMLQESAIRAALLKTATEGGAASTAAAKVLLSPTQVKAPIGRPKKPKEVVEEPSTPIEADVIRISSFRE